MTAVSGEYGNNFLFVFTPQRVNLMSQLCLLCTKLSLDRNTLCHIAYSFLFVFTPQRVSLMSCHIAYSFLQALLCEFLYVLFCIHMCIYASHISFSLFLAVSLVKHGTCYHKVCHICDLCINYAVYGNMLCIMQ